MLYIASYFEEYISLTIVKIEADDIAKAKTKFKGYLEDNDLCYHFWASNIHIVSDNEVEIL